MAKLPIPFNNPATYPGHSGIDFAQPRGTIFRASGSGVVTTLSRNDAGGYYIWVKYDALPFAVGYHHMDSHNGCPRVGTRVNEGDRLGYVGNSGHSTGPHLHSEVDQNRTTAGYWKYFDSSRVVGGGSTAGSTVFNQTVKDQQTWLISRGYDLGPSGADGLAGDYYRNAVKKYETFLRAYGYGGEIDGIWGPGVQSAHEKYYAEVNNPANEALKAQQAWLISRGYDLGQSGADGIWGPKTEAAIKAYQTFLRAWGYSGDIDGKWGPGTQTAHEKFAASLVSQPEVPPFPLPANQWFGPEAGGENSISGWYSHNEDLKRWQQRMKDRGWPITVDGLYGPKGATTPQGNTAEVTIAFQKEKGLVADGLIGPTTWAAAWTTPVTPETPTPAPPQPTDPTTPSPEGALITPSNDDFPSWIRFEVYLDPESANATEWGDVDPYYKVPYKPVESHVHWWGAPDQAGSHDGNATHLFNTKDLSVNFVVSENRITLMVPLDRIALTTGQRNPYAWKSENDPTLTEQQYKTMGYLHYIVEKLNPSLLNEPIRHHKEFMNTSCSEIDKAKVRFYAEQFRTGALDPATGEAPVVDPGTDPEPTPEPQPQPDTVVVPKKLLEIVKSLPSEFRSLADHIDEYLV